MADFLLQVKKKLRKNLKNNPLPISMTIEGVMKKPRGRPRKNALEALPVEKKLTEQPSAPSEFIIPPGASFKEITEQLAQLEHEQVGSPDTSPEPESISDYYKTYDTPDEFRPVNDPSFIQTYSAQKTPESFESFSEFSEKKNPDDLLRKIIKREVTPSEKRVENTQRLTPSKKSHGFFAKFDNLLTRLEKKILGDNHPDDEWLDEWLEK